MAESLIRRNLDVSELEHPEPMEQIMEILPELNLGEYLYVTHRREPYPLYTILETMGFNYQCNCLGVGDYEIFIWSKQDKQAETYFSQQN